MKLREALDRSRTTSAELRSGGGRVAMLMEIPANPDPGKVNHVWYALTSVSDADVARVWEARANPWPAWDHLPEAITRRDDWQPMFPKHSLELLVEGIAADAGKSGP